MAYPGGNPPGKDDDIHLLLTTDVEEPFFRSLARSIKELIHPPKLPPLELTSKPVAVKEIWGFYGGQGRRAGVSSILIHAGVIALLLFLGTNKTVQKVVKQQIDLIAPDHRALQAQPSRKITMKGGGGGGDRSPTPVSKGKLPKLANKQFVPPMITHVGESETGNGPDSDHSAGRQYSQGGFTQFGRSALKIRPGLQWLRVRAAEWAADAAAVSGRARDLDLARVLAAVWAAALIKIGGGVSSPQLLFKVEPEYSEEARKAKFQGTVLLYVEVDEKGNPRDIRVIRPLGLGLDQKAIEAVEKWKFSPGKKDGKPVAVQAQIEVNFRLL